MGAWVMTKRIDWSMDFSKDEVVSKWCHDYHRGYLVDAPKVRQFIGVLALVWQDEMRRLLKQCYSLLLQRKCHSQATNVDGFEKYVFCLGDVVRVFGNGDLTSKIEESEVFISSNFLADTYCTLSYGEENATLLCWSQKDVSYDMMCMCDMFRMEVSVMPETRFGYVYDIVAKYNKQA